MSGQRYRITVFGEPRSTWRCSAGEAIDDAARMALASYDEEAGENYLAVPVALEASAIGS
ncbi:hypothetical protein [Sphingomonas sp. BK235]|uniref:hypothetical protein n=1 Tax=Sphingomonas sp. BK235 TaxID=2512131 RepID=UPI00104DC221|nr:hypothetical protein [Sphingomonas sp. BK235]